jgi:hypothetical protein
MNAHEFNLRFEDEESVDDVDTVKAWREEYARRGGTATQHFDNFPTYATNAPLVIWTSKSTTIESFRRAVRKAKQRGLRLLSYHFSGAKFVAQFGA